MQLPKLCRNPDGRAYSTYPKTGGKKREYFGLYGTPEAKAKYKLWIVQIASAGTCPVPAAGPDALVVDLSNAYLAYLLPRCCRGEYLGCLRALKRLVAAFGDKPMRSLSVTDITGLMEGMAGEQYRRTYQGKATQSDKPRKASKPRSYSRDYINKTLNRIKRFARWCKKRQYITADTLQRFEDVDQFKPRDFGIGETAPVRPVALSVVKATLPHLSPVVAAMVQVQYLCGMRPQDVCQMRWCDIDQSDEIWLYCPMEHKNTHRGLELTKAIPDAAQTILKGFQTENDTDFIFTPRRSMQMIYRDEKRYRNRSFRSRYEADSYGQAIKKACKSAKLEHWTPNQLRHAIATDLRRTRGLEATQRYLGHSDGKTTLIYAERSVEEIKMTAATMANPFVEHGAQQHIDEPFDAYCGA